MSVVAHVHELRRFTSSPHFRSAQPLGGNVSTVRPALATITAAGFATAFTTLEQSVSPPQGTASFDGQNASVTTGQGSTLTWDKPATYADGTSIPDADIAGYQIWSKSPSGTSSTKRATISDANTTDYDLTNLASGSYELLVYVEFSDGSIEPLYRDYVSVTV